MLILGIESSCDETSAAVVRDGRHVLSCIISSCKDDFRSTGGVIPEEAARQQQKVIIPCIREAMDSAGCHFQDLECIAVTNCPGLLGSLLVGTTAARALACIHRIPLVAVHHTLGHLSSVWLQKDEASTLPAFPCMTLSVSGGHTDLWYRTSHTKGVLVGSTLDDAAGEAFDKGAVLLGLPYPGGPALSKLAESGDQTAFPFPLPLQHETSGVSFSFSGLKTSLKYALREMGSHIDPALKSSLAASYEYAICRHLCEKTSAALKRFPDTKEIHLVGGVSANRRLRLMMEDTAKHAGCTLRVPASLKYCTDNGAMIAAAGEFLVRERPSTLNDAWITQATAPLARVLEFSN